MLPDGSSSLRSTYCGYSIYRIFVSRHTLWIFNLTLPKKIYFQSLVLFIDFVKFIDKYILLKIKDK